VAQSIDVADLAIGTVEIRTTTFLEVAGVRAVIVLPADPVTSIESFLLGGSIGWYSG
jgi:hypothetical protein